MLNFFYTYIKLFSKIVGYISDIKGIVISVLFVATFLALSEGISILLLIPILDSSGDLAHYADKPLIGPVALWLGNMELTERLVTVASILASVIFLRGCLQLLLTYLSLMIQLKVMSKISRHALGLILKVDLSFIHRRDFAIMRTYFDELPINMAEALNAFIKAISTALLLCIYLMMMMTISWKMTLLACVFIILLGGGIKLLLVKPLRNLGECHADAQVGWGNVIFTALLGSTVIRLSNARTQIKDKYDGAILEHVKMELHRQVLMGANGPLVTMGAGIFICAIIAGVAIVNGGSNGAWMVTLMIFIITLFRMMSPASEFLSSTVMIAAQFVSFERMDKFFIDATKETMPDGDLVFTGLKKDIRVKNLIFEYEEQVNKKDTADGVTPISTSNGTVALKNVNLSIPKGRMLALVGASGAGKSTLASILCRLYDPQKGSVLVDGKDLRKFDVSSWRSRISLVSQDIFLFNDSVLNNIRFGFEETGIERIQEAARMASAIDFIEDLPQGWDTQLGEMGVRLSGGQKQRISIARAILNDPDILILDEATSHLDSITERAIQATIEQLSKERTVIVIAHRLSTVKKADTIAVMAQGEIVEQGTHNELVKLKGNYWDLLQHQALDTGEVDLQSAEVKSNL